MAAQATVGEHDATRGGGASGAASRMLHARLDLMVHTFLTASWFNPCLAVLWILPFSGLFPKIGTMPWSQLAIVMAVQLVLSIGSVMIYYGYRRDPTDSILWLRCLVLYQAATGTGWGLFVWLIWSDGNPLNNVLVTLTVSGIVWAYAFSRAMHARVYLAGVLPTVLLTIARIFYSGTDLAVPLSFITAITFVFVYIFTFGLRRQVEVMLGIRFANEDLAVELRSTRDDALRKRFEAETANASKTKFLANMSHELRTPLNAILGFSDLIATEMLGPVGSPRYREYARDINTSGSHLLSLITDILDISKIESGKMDIAPSLIDAEPAIEGVINVIQSNASAKHQSIAAQIDSSVSGLFVDERAFKQIAINLLSNAVKFTPDGGHISVSLKAVSGGCEFCVTDDGPGIAAELLDQIFTPFNQIDNCYNRQAGGTGLGLSLVRGLAELHGGRAWIVSDTGKGVRAYVFLPNGPAADAERRSA
jgi:two-component system, cell cycle sensor histidine kinase PleC